MKRSIIVLLSLAILLGLFSCRKREYFDQLVIGRVITMDNSHPFADAVGIKNGTIVYVGPARTALNFCSKSTTILNYDSAYVYPGFIDANINGTVGASRMIIEADLSSDTIATMQQYVDIMQKYILDNPGHSIYRGYGWKLKDCQPDAKMLDAICSEIPIILTSSDNHQIWLNSVAMCKFGVHQALDSTKITKAKSAVHPNGWIKGIEAFNVYRQASPTKDEYKHGILKWQSLIFSKGYTAVSEVCDNITNNNAIRAYSELAKEGKLQLRTYSTHYISSDKKMDSELNELLQLAKNYENEYFKINGVVVFVDAETENRMAWMIDPYNDDHQYYGNNGYINIEKLTKITKFANENELYVHAICNGDGAVHSALDAICTAEDITNIKTCRNAISVIKYIHPDDIMKMADYNVMALVEPLSIPIDTTTFETEKQYFGMRTMSQYPIKSILTYGCRIAFQSYYPLRNSLNIPMTICAAVARNFPNLPSALTNNSFESISRKQALRAMTIDAAYSIKQEKKLGSISLGKVANFTVIDFNFLKDDLQHSDEASVIATIIEGKEVYHK